MTGELGRNYLNVQRGKFPKSLLFFHEASARIMVRAVPTNKRAILLAVFIAFGAFNLRSISELT
jgi:hypothetical protein